MLGWGWYWGWIQLVSDLGCVRLELHSDVVLHWVELRWRQSSSWVVLGSELDRVGDGGGYEFPW